MYRYILRKFIASIITLLIVVVLVYFTYVSVKPNPIPAPASQKDMPAYITKLELYHINDPVYIRFWYWISDLFHGESGVLYNSYGVDYKTTADLVFKPMKNTMIFVIPSYFIGMFLGLGLGFWAGYKRGKLTDVIINIVITFFIAIPTFIFAVFVIVLGPKLGLLTRYQDPSLPGITIGAQINSLILPISVSSLLSLRGWAYLTRTEVSSILASDYILAARTRGISGFTLFRKYVLRNAMYPFIGSLVTSFMIVFSGSLIIEKFFGINGSSYSLLQANKNGEINVMMFNILFFSGIGLFTQMLSDIAQFSINPVIKSNFSSDISPIRKFMIARRRNKKAKELNNIGGNND